MLVARALDPVKDVEGSDVERECFDDVGCPMAEPECEAEHHVTYFQTIFLPQP